MPRQRRLVQRRLRQREHRADALAAQPGQVPIQRCQPLGLAARLAALRPLLSLWRLARARAPGQRAVDEPIETGHHTAMLPPYTLIAVDAIGAPIRVAAQSWG